MRKTSSLFLATLVFVLVVTPAFALETKLSGFYQAMAAVDNFRATNNYIGTLEENSESENLVDQRIRLKLDGKVNEQLSFVYQGEIDMQWGDASFVTARNEGGAIGADSVNLETKHAFINVKFDDGETRARLGLQGFYDRTDYTLVAADMAGATLGFKLREVGLTAAMFNLIEGDFDESDNIYLWALQANFADMGNLSLGADYYYYQNRGPAGYVNFIGTADMPEVLFAGPGWSANRGDMDIHFLTVQGDYTLSDDSALNGWLMFNNGSVDDAFAVGTESDIQGYAASVRGTFKLGAADMAARLIYFNGDDDLSDDFDFFVNPLAVENFAFYGDGFMIFLQDKNWANIGQYGFAMTDAAYAGFGLLAGNVTAKVTPMDQVTLECGAGYFASTEDTLAAGDPRTDRDGTTLGTEVFVRAGYTFANDLNLSLNGAYAWLGDFYDNAGGGTAIDTAMTDVDNPYLVSLVASLGF